MSSERTKRRKVVKRLQDNCDQIAEELMTATVTSTAYMETTDDSSLSSTSNLSDNVSNRDELLSTDSNNESSLYESDSDESVVDDNDNQEPAPSIQLAFWAVQYGITTRALRALLKILHPYLDNLPKDPRTLLSTGSVTGIKPIDGGSYYHMGLTPEILSALELDSRLKFEKNIRVQVNIDGLPLFKSSGYQFWPILGRFPQACERNSPFLIGLFGGSEKPNCAKEFLHDFVKELKAIQVSGVEFNNQSYLVEI